MTQATAERKKTSVINSKFISHGTLGSTDLDRTRKFYEEFLGLEVVRTSPVSLFVRLGGNHVYAVVKQKQLKPMYRINHNGVDVDTDAEVDEAFKACHEQAEKWGITNITKPVAVHGTYSFHFVDADGNDWEILSNPRGGYTWIFDKGDLDGKGHFSKGFRHERPDGK